MLFNQTATPSARRAARPSQFGLFGNFGLVIDKGVHFIDVNAELRSSTCSIR